jgi:hypothetical protein
VVMRVVMSPYSLCMPPDRGERLMPMNGSSRWCSDDMLHSSMDISVATVALL